MEQTKALNALEPFLALSKSATSPRAAADLVTRATSAPNTYIFAELLDTSAIQALSQSPEFLPYHTLLQIFSYGTYQTYQQTPQLPSLSEPQILKLRQLSLLSLARRRSNLFYEPLQQSLGLDSARQLEDLVISAVYAGLLHATLDPARQAVEVTRVAPLRDLERDAIPAMIQSLQSWSDTCTSTLGDLEEQIKSIRETAAARGKEKRAADKKMQELLAETQPEKPLARERDPLARTRAGLQKRQMGGASAASGAGAQEDMDVDEAVGIDEAQNRATKRKM